VLVVQVSSGGGVGIDSHPVVGSHLTGAPVDPLHVVDVWLLQTMPVPQLASLVHGAGWQVRTTVGVSSRVHATPEGQALVSVPATWHERPAPQSASVAQVWARLGCAKTRGDARVATIKSAFLGVMLHLRSERVELGLPWFTARGVPGFVTEGLLGLSGSWVRATEPDDQFSDAWPRICHGPPGIP
jgi:hypothetical protein